MGREPHKSFRMALDSVRGKEAENEELWPELKTLNVILTPKESHQRIISINV